MPQFVVGALHYLLTTISTADALSHTHNFIHRTILHLCPLCVIRISETIVTQKKNEEIKLKFLMFGIDTPFRRHLQRNRNRNARPKYGCVH